VVASYFSVEDGHPLVVLVVLGIPSAAFSIYIFTVVRTAASNIECYILVTTTRLLH
jgi:hypothetical protein